MALLYEKKGRIAYLTIDRPEAMNALTIEDLSMISEVSDDFSDDSDSWVMIVSGTGDQAFCTGADLKALSSVTGEATEDTPEIPTAAQCFFSAVYKPIIAAINGICLAGGMELVLGTDIRIAAEHATFGLPEVRWGFMPGKGGIVRLSHHIAWCRAMQMLLAADTITAQQAYEFGLVNEVVPLPDLMPVAEKYASKICDNGPLAVRAIKETAMRSLGVSLDEGFLMESQTARRLFASEDAREGPRAFMEKRKPQFRGQ